MTKILNLQARSTAPPHHVYLKIPYNRSGIAPSRSMLLPTPKIQKPIGVPPPPPQNPNARPPTEQVRKIRALNKQQHQTLSAGLEPGVEDLIMQKVLSAKRAAIENFTDRAKGRALPTSTIPTAIACEKSSGASTPPDLPKNCCARGCRRSDHRAFTGRRLGGGGSGAAVSVVGAQPSQFKAPPDDIKTLFINGNGELFGSEIEDKRASPGRAILINRASGVLSIWNRYWPILARPIRGRLPCGTLH